jgi:hypothetical protein
MKYSIYILIFILILATVSCGHNSGVLNRMPENEGVINFKDFYVGSESTDLETLTRGTVFIKKDDFSNYLVQIVAWVEIDPMDRGGVGFTIPFGWKVTSITSSYPDGRRDYNPEDYVETWQTRDYWFNEWSTRVNIGCSLQGGSPSGGGAGSVVIELESTSKEPNPYPGFFKTIIGVGYEEREEYNVLHTDYERIELSLLQPVPDLEIELTLDRPPILGDILQLTCKASLEHWLKQGVSGVTIDIRLPEAFELIDGDLNWSGDIAGGSAVTMQATLRAVEMGEHSIGATALYSFSKYRYIKWDTIYLGVFDDRGFIGDEHLEFESARSPRVSALASSDIRSVLQLETALGDIPALNKPVEVTCTVTAVQDVSGMKEISINWDEGFEFLDGNPLWKGGLAKGEQVELTATLMPVKTGHWNIYTQCSGTFHYDRGTQGSGSSTGTYIYDHLTVYMFEDSSAVIDISAVIYKE